MELKKQHNATDSHKAAEHLRLIVDSMSDGLIIVDADGAIANMNHMAGKITGFVPSMAIGQPASQILRDVLDRRGDFVDPTETMVTCADGKSAPVELSVRALVTESGSEFIVTMRDISELKTAHSLLEQQALIIERSESFAFVLDAQGQLEWVNARFEQLTGYPSAELMRQEFSALLMGQGTDSNTRREFDQAVTSDQPFQGEVLLYRKSGQPFWAQIDINSMGDSSGRAASTVGLGFDITDRKYADQMQLDFISMVSHDLRTPLTVIHGAFEALTMSPDQFSPDVLDMLADMGKRNCEQLDKLIEDLLDVNKMQTGTFVLNYQRVDLIDLIESSMSNLAAIADQASITLSHERSREPIELYADPGRIEQVITNLLSNAIKFAPAGTVVTLNTEFSDTHARVLVTDQGRGIPEDFRPMMFRRFSREESVQAEGCEGFGLGLSICKRLVEQMQGEISYRSELGRGSCFFFDLPIEGVAPAQPKRRQTDATSI